MEEITQMLNQFMVQNFNNILRWEERSLASYKNGILSVNEFHVIEAVINAQKIENNTMSEISKMLGVTVGSLTTAVKTLIKKNYIIRQKGSIDKRTVWLFPTPEAIEANSFHQNFHTRLVQEIADLLEQQELLVLLKAMDTLGEWFTALEHESDYISIPNNQT